MQRSGDEVARHIGVTFCTAGDRPGVRAAVGAGRDWLRRHAARPVEWGGRFAKVAIVALLIPESMVLPASANSIDDVIERGFAAVISGQYKTYPDYLFARAEQQDAVAAFVLGSMYENGTFGSRDLKLAVKFYLQSAELGYAKAQLAIGDLLQRAGDKSAAAIAWYLRAAAQSDAEAQRKLGLVYMLGQDVPREIGKAIEWFVMAARRDDRLAKRYLGHIYRNGIDVPKSSAEALKWYHRAAQDGDDVAQYFYGLMVATGEATLRNRDEAKIWLSRAAHQNNAKAMLALGILLLGEDGDTDGRDRVQAYRWMDLAAERGSIEATEQRNALARTMTADQLRDARNGDRVPGTLPGIEASYADRR